MRRLTAVLALSLTACGPAFTYADANDAGGTLDSADMLDALGASHDVGSSSNDASDATDEVDNSDASDAGVITLDGPDGADDANDGASAAICCILNQSGAIWACTFDHPYQCNTFNGLVSCENGPCVATNECQSADALNIGKLGSCIVE